MEIYLYVVYERNPINERSNICNQEYTHSEGGNLNLTAQKKFPYIFVVDLFDIYFFCAPKWVKN